MLTIRDRLNAIAAVAVSAVRRASWLNLASTALLLVGAIWIQRTAVRSQAMSELATLAEKQQGLVSRAVAEMDLSRQAELLKSFSKVSAEIIEKGRDGGVDVEGDVLQARQHGEEAFKLAAAFAQQQAMAVSDGPFASATSRIQQTIHAETGSAQAAVFRAVLALFVLGLGSLAVQVALGRATTRRLAILLDDLARGLSVSVEQCASVAERIAGGHLDGTTRVVQEEGTKETARLAIALRSMEERLREVMNGIQVTAHSLSQGAEQVASSAHVLSMGTARQAASMEETTASIHQMASSISQNAQLSQLTEDLAAQSLAGARQGSESVEETVLAMQKVIETASIIGELANRTHLLSLNAAIEAARAGDHGRGFAVIATEVRSLANKSTLALTEIRAVAESSIGVARQAVTSIESLTPTSEKTAAAAVQVAA
ncbi:MAG: methyl-accepting chemotaxis protein, partial [Vicinamibacteria bacterium]